MQGLYHCIIRKKSDQQKLTNLIKFYPIQQACAKYFWIIIIILWIISRFNPAMPQIANRQNLPLKKEPEVRMLPLPLPGQLSGNLPSSLPSGLAGKKVLINPHFKGNFQPPVEGVLSRHCSVSSAAKKAQSQFIVAFQTELLRSLQKPTAEYEDTSVSSWYLVSYQGFWCKTWYETPPWAQF